MIFELNEMIDCKSTRFTTVKSVNHMQASMQRTAGRKIKAQRAQAAFVSTFVRMDADVILETFGGPKRFVTVRATVASYLLMRSRMIVQ